MTRFREKFRYGDFGLKKWSIYPWGRQKNLSKKGVTL